MTTPAFRPRVRRSRARSPKFKIALRAPLLGIAPSTPGPLWPRRIGWRSTMLRRSRRRRG
eukprot:16124878-Heterocapsa_arctica.AAC.1